MRACRSEMGDNLGSIGVAMGSVVSVLMSETATHQTGTNTRVSHENIRLRSYARLRGSIDSLPFLHSYSMSSLLDIGVPLRSALTAVLQTYLSTYIRDIQLDGIGLLGDVVLHNLELRLDALQELLPPSLPFTFTRGFVRELRISIPWTSLTSTPIHIRVDTVEVVATTREDAALAAARAGGKGGAPVAPAPPAPAPAAPSTLPEWIQSRIMRVLANIRLTMTNVVLKYRHRHVALVAAIRTLDVSSANADANWAPAFIAPVGATKEMTKTISVQDLSVMCDTMWDRAESGASTQVRGSSIGRGAVDAGRGAAPAERRWSRASVASSVSSDALSVSSGRGTSGITAQESAAEAALRALESGCVDIPTCARVRS